jgi:hypothetical protein
MKLWFSAFNFKHAFVTLHTRLPSTKNATHLPQHTEGLQRMRIQDRLERDAKEEQICGLNFILLVL